MENRILLVDDEEQFVVALKKRLAARGLIVDTAESGERAEQLASEHRYDAVVLDLAMPGMDGIETLDRLLKLDADAQVILLSGHGSIRAATDALQHGAADFLEKPANFDELLEKIRSAIAKRLQLSAHHTDEQISEILAKKGW